MPNCSLTNARNNFPLRELREFNWTYDYSTHNFVYRYLKMEDNCPIYAGDLKMSKLLLLYQEHLCHFR
jgi:hypothetical protein